MKTKALNTILFTLLSVSSIFSQMSLQTTSIDPTCNGYANGQIIIDITGGLPPYSVNGLEISGSQFIAGNLSSGQFLFNISDANFNSSSFNTTLIDPQPLIIEILKTDVTTFGGNDGTANITILNGTAQYNWSGNGFSFISNQEDQYNLTSGIYNVEITATDGCQYVKRVIINQPQPGVLPGVINPQIQGFQQNTFTISQ